MNSTSTTVRRTVWQILTRLDAWANRLYGSRYNPLYHSGAIVIGLLLVLVATGLYLLLFYRVGAPWASVARITEQAWLGRWIRGVHRFASDAAVVAAAVHAFRMYAQHRSWGPRALAWVSGLALLAVIFVCGWTGYVLVWDVHALLLAAEGARILDVLPIFSEPLGRTFVGEHPLPSAFFFLNLFAHIALPIGVGLLVWIHVSRLARPVLLPPRRVLWGVVAALVALAVMWPVGMAPEADPLRLPEGFRSTCSSGSGSRSRGGSRRGRCGRRAARLRSWRCWRRGGRGRRGRRGRPRQRWTRGAARGASSAFRIARTTPSRWCRESRATHGRDWWRW